MVYEGRWGTLSGVDVDYRERLRVPLWWWLLGAALVATIFVTVAVAIPLVLAVALTVGVALAIILGLTTYGGAQIRVTSSGPRQLIAHRAQIDAQYLGAAEALDAEQTRHASGRDADPRAYLLLRPYARGAVRVQITDPDDPTPYWLISSRNPARLADAIACITRATDG